MYKLWLKDSILENGDKLNLVMFRRYEPNKTSKLRIEWRHTNDFQKFPYWNNDFIKILMDITTHTHTNTYNADENMFNTITRYSGL